LGYGGRAGLEEAHPEDEHRSIRSPVERMTGSASSAYSALRLFRRLSHQLPGGPSVHGSSGCRRASGSLFDPPAGGQRIRGLYPLSHKRVNASAWRAPESRVQAAPDAAALKSAHRPRRRRALRHNSDKQPHHRQTGDSIPRAQVSGDPAWALHKGVPGQSMTGDRTPWAYDRLRSPVAERSAATARLGSTATGESPVCERSLATARLGVTALTVRSLPNDPPEPGAKLAGPTVRSLPNNPWEPRAHQARDHSRCSLPNIPPGSFAWACNNEDSLAAERSAVIACPGAARTTRSLPNASPHRAP